MPIEALPAAIEQTLYVSLYAANNPPTPSVTTWKTESANFIHLFELQMLIPVPAKYQDPKLLTRLTLIQIDEQVRKTRVEFEDALQALERTRQQFLALEA